MVTTERGFPMVLPPDDFVKPEIINEWRRGGERNWFMARLTHNSFAIDEDASCNGIVYKKFRQGDRQIEESFCQRCSQPVCVDLLKLTIYLRLR